MSGRMGEWSLKLPYDAKPIRLQPSMIFVGRSECDILVNSTTVDKRHAVIYFNQHDQQFHIKDLNTLSGTYVNGIRIPEQSYVKLEHGDQIRFGYHKQAFEMQLSRGNDEVDTTRSSTAAAPEAGMAATPLEDDDSLNESDTLVISNNSAIRGHPIAQQQNQNTLLQQQRQTSPMKGCDSLEDVSMGSIAPRPPTQRGELHKNHSVPTLESPASPLSENVSGGLLKRGAHVPRDLSLVGMVASYHAAPVRSPSEPQIDNRMVASSLWDQEVKRSPQQATAGGDRERQIGVGGVNSGVVGTRRPVAMTIPADGREPFVTYPVGRGGLNNHTSNNNNDGSAVMLQSNGTLHVENTSGGGAGGAATGVNNGAVTSPKKSPSETAKENHGDGIHCTTRTKNKAKAFVINFDEPRRRASIPQSVLQRRELAARNKEEECRVSEFSGDSAGTGGTVQNGLNGSLSDSANFLIQKMLQSNNDGPNVDGDDEEIDDEAGEEDGDHRSEAGTYTVDDPQAREARTKIDQVFGVHRQPVPGEIDETNSFKDYQNRTRTFSKINKHNVPVTRTQPVVAPPRRNRTTSSTTFLASSVPTPSNLMTDSMMSSTISSGSSTGGLPSKPAVVRAKITTTKTPVSSNASGSAKVRRPSSGVSRPPSARSTASTTAISYAQREPVNAGATGRVINAEKSVTSSGPSTLRRGTYGGSDFSLESSNSSGSHLTGGDSMKMNRAFALRRARLGLQEPVVSQKVHLLTGSNPNLFSRQDGGRFSMRLPSAKQRTRPGADLNHQIMSESVSNANAAGLLDTSRTSPRNCRRNESDPCNINLLGQESDGSQDMAMMCIRPEHRLPQDADALSQSTLEPNTQGRDAPCDIADMCRSASFNAHPDARDRDIRTGAGSLLLRRKETFLKQHISPQHQPLEDRATCTAPTRSGRGGRTASPSRTAFSPQLQRRALGSPLSPQIARKVLPSPQASPCRQKPPTGFTGHPASTASLNSGGDKERQQPGLSALDTLVVQAISQLSGKLRFSARALVERESRRYPEGSDALLTIQELLSSTPASSTANAGDISKELSGILRNLRNIEQSLSLLSALEPGPPIPPEVPEQDPVPEPKELPDAESLGDTVPRGFFTVSF
ncbi:uncharacterized protein LOC111249102 isoform X2 [Varroa destructor]|uniref:FHA domain-containing protein n=1 Tax=Varroa destructor TaxID=109461 RepID=A0A7M7JWL0_VARDE|nr:uncharacterized protein LOC111249102 isoform X2 [Varroa destructor]